jgi:hypothetical protein
MRACRLDRAVGIGLATALVACAMNPTSASLTVRGSLASSGSSDSRVLAAASALHAVSRGALGPGQMTGDPGVLRIGMYALYISSNADCSSPTLVEDYGTSSVAKDIVQSPTLFAGSPPAGSYSCVGVKMSDVLAMRPSTTFGSCDSTVTYAESIYNTNNTNPADTSSFFRDINLQPIAPLGTRADPEAEPVLILFTRDTAAATARGFNPGQVIPLGAPLVVPSTDTFVWGGSGTVLSDSASGTCSVNPGRPTFE